MSASWPPSGGSSVEARTCPLNSSTVPTARHPAPNPPPTHPLSPSGPLTPSIDSTPITGNDCGVMVLAVAKCLLRQLPFSFHGRDTTLIRYAIADEIIAKRLS